MGEQPRKLVVDAAKSGPIFNFRELYRYKDLFMTLAYRDYRVRYAQTFLGFAWAFIQPLFTILIATVIFGYALNVDTGGVPYPLFACSGLVCWAYFSFVVTNSGSSVISAQNMVKKIYFPRLIIPLSKAVVGLIDFGMVVVIMIALFIIYGFAPEGNLFTAPLFILMAVIASLGVGIWLSALTIRYRDFQHMVPFMLQLGIYITPVMFPAEVIMKRFPDWAVTIYYLNPMAGIIDGFRWSLFGGEAPAAYQYLSFGMAFVLLLTSLIYFRKMERSMADII